LRRRRPGATPAVPWPATRRSRAGSGPGRGRAPAGSARRDRGRGGGARTGRHLCRGDAERRPRRAGGDPMIRARGLEEWREQRTIALAVLAFGVLALFLTAQFAPATGGGSSILARQGARELMAPALAYLAGAVCGAMLLADEKEAGTIEFLDALPCLR